MKYTLLIGVLLLCCCVDSEPEPGDCHLLEHVDGGQVLECFVEPDAD